MFIRRTQTRNRSYGEPYLTYRLVHSARVGSSVKQSTLLNLGSHFDLPQGQWFRHLPNDSRAATRSYGRRALADPKQPIDLGMSDLSLRPHAINRATAV